MFYDDCCRLNDVKSIIFNRRSNLDANLMQIVGHSKCMAQYLQQFRYNKRGRQLISRLKVTFLFVKRRISAWKQHSLATAEDFSLPCDNLVNDSLLFTCCPSEIDSCCLYALMSHQVGK